MFIVQKEEPKSEKAPKSEKCEKCRGAGIPRDPSIYIYICMYVCMYVCIYIYIYIAICVPTRKMRYEMHVSVYSYL